MFSLSFRTALYRSVIHIVFSLRFRDCTYIDRSFTLCSIWVLGPHYIDQSFTLCSVYVLGSHSYQSVIFLLVWIQFESGSHLYQSVIHLISSVFGTIPISIDHLLIISVRVRDRTYIDKLSSMSVWVWVFNVDCTYTTSHTFVSSVLSLV